MIVGIDASRCRSGGAKGHLIGILSEADPASYGIHEIHVWSHSELCNALPDRPWLVKHNPNTLEQSLLRQVLWQRFSFAEEARKVGCAIVVNTDAGTVARFAPSVTISQDMLSYEPGAIQRFGLSAARVRLLLLRHIQSQSLKRSKGVIFLSRYAAKIIQQSSGPLKRLAFVPHGIDKEYKSIVSTRTWPKDNSEAIRCVYVSNAAMYKHQWEVIRAFAKLRGQALNVKLVLAGGGAGRAQRLVDAAIAECDPNRTFVELAGAVPHEKLPLLIANSDMFVFASSCENMPITLLEGMAAGLPIACSNRGPMPEILKNGGVYFDPEAPDSIAAAAMKIISAPELRQSITARAKALSEQYSWSRCADETLRFVVKTHSASSGTIKNSAINDL